MRAIQPAVFITFVLLCSCNFLSKKKPSESIVGDWLIIFPDHRLTSIKERVVYAKYQDSIVSLYGLKLISLSEDGAFTSIDSLPKPSGRWLFTNDSLLQIREGGRGFNPFTASYKKFSNDTLQLISYLPLEGEKIMLVWYLKKIENDNEASQLFKASYNEWRKKPGAPESGKAMRKRVAAMLDYNAKYFKLVSKEAIYFSPARVPLPLRYYQHGIGLNSELSTAFKNLFYNDADATKAYRILQKAMRANNIASAGENYVTEYALFLEKMGAEVGK